MGAGLSVCDVTNVQTQHYMQYTTTAVIVVQRVRPSNGSIFTMDDALKFNCLNDLNVKAKMLNLTGPTGPTGSQHIAHLLLLEDNINRA